MKNLKVVFINNSLLVVLVLVSFLIIGCAKTFEAEYSDPTKVEIVDDKWNETDARKTAEFLVKSMFERPWFANFKAKNAGKKPLIIVDEVENRTDEHIDTKALTEFITDELVNSGKVGFLDKSRRQKIIDEIRYQRESGAVDLSKARQAGKQYGAHYFMGGAITSSVHTQGGLKTVTYQTSMTLTNLETAEIEWSGKYLVKKRFKRSGSKW